jgi:hypothetical protein
VVQERLAKKHIEDPLARGKGPGLSGVTRPGAWLLREISYDGLQRGLGENLLASRYLSKTTRVVDGSLHLYRSLTFRIYIMYLGCVLTFLA